MYEIEKKQQEIRELRAPDNMEKRLRQTLEKQKIKRRIPTLWAAAAVILLLFTFTYNYSAFAYYGKKLFGYEELMTDSLMKLNEVGAGQAVGKSILLSDGTIFTIEGIMSDTNRFHLFYKLENEQGKFDEHFTLTQIHGFLTKSFANAGTYVNSEDGTERTGILSFDAVNAFAKKLTVQMFDSTNHYDMTIPYDAAAAIPTILKHSINKTLSYDYGKLKFKKIIVTSASAVITGRIIDESERNVRVAYEGLKLLADGEEIAQREASQRSGIFSDKVELLYDAIPQNTEKLEIVMDVFNGYDEINQEISIDAIDRVNVGGKWLEILWTEQRDGDVHVNIVSDHGVLFDDVSIETSGGEIPLHVATMFNDHEKGWSRTLLFNTSEEVLALKIGKVYYDKQYGEKIEIKLK